MSFQCHILSHEQHFITTDHDVIASSILLFSCNNVIHAWRFFSVVGSGVLFFFTFNHNWKNHNCVEYQRSSCHFLRLYVVVISFVELYFFIFLQNAKNPQTICGVVYIDVVDFLWLEFLWRYSVGSWSPYIYRFLHRYTTSSANYCIA
jgi:hypothetical protein